MEGCGEPLAKGQYWQFCGETDMGQTAPVLCEACGGNLKLWGASTKKENQDGHTEINNSGHHHGRARP
jgi:hypothetical protein